MSLKKNIAIIGSAFAFASTPSIDPELQAFAAELVEASQKPLRRKRTPRHSNNPKKKVNKQAGNPPRASKYTRVQLKAIDRRRKANKVARKSRKRNRA